METQKEENKEEINKLASSKKSKILLAAIIIAGVLIGWEIGIRVYFYYIRPYFSGMAYRNYVDDYIQLQLNDKVGGDTPEETVDLFIAALKKGDYDLASKYFVIDEQEKWKKMFDEATKQQNEDWAKEIEGSKNFWHKEIQAEDKIEFWYNTGEGENKRTHSVYLQKNMNNKWKINHF